MSDVIIKCRDAGIVAAQSALTGRREGSLDGALKSYFDMWVEDIAAKPTDEMIAAWLVGFSGILAAHFSLIKSSSLEGSPTLN